jgi:hypothetical protein
MVTDLLPKFDALVYELGLSLVRADTCFFALLVVHTTDCGFVVVKELTDGAEDVLGYDLGAVVSFHCLEIKGYN